MLIYCDADFGNLMRVNVLVLTTMYDDKTESKGPETAIFETTLLTYLLATQPCEELFGKFF